MKKFYDKCEIEIVRLALTDVLNESDGLVDIGDYWENETELLPTDGLFN